MDYRNNMLYLKWTEQAESGGIPMFKQWKSL
jgi:hypothetical protein